MPGALSGCLLSSGSTPRCLPSGSLEGEAERPRQSNRPAVVEQLDGDLGCPLFLRFVLAFSRSITVCGSESSWASLTLLGEGLLPAARSGDTAHAPLHFWLLPSHGLAAACQSYSMLLLLLWQVLSV